MARSAKDIADMLQRLQDYYAAVSTALIFLNDDDALRLLQAKGYDPGSTIRLGRRDDSYYEGIKIWDAIHSVRGNAGFNLDFLGSLFMTALSWTGDELSKKRLLRQGAGAGVVPAPPQWDQPRQQVSSRER